MIALGHQFGLYVIKEIIAASDSSACCKAEDPFFNREVILKVFSTAALKTEKQPQILENLLEKLALLDHPSIAPIYDFGLEGELFYYTTNGYFGGHLQAQFTGPLAAAELLKLAAELAGALDYAFSQQCGVPRLLAKKIYFDAEGRAVLTDFGIACGLDELLAAGDETEPGRDKAESGELQSACLRSLGELLLQLSVGPAVDLESRSEELIGRVDDLRLRNLLDRLLLQGERRFGTFRELLAELADYPELAPLFIAETSLPTGSLSASAPAAPEAEFTAAEQQTVAEVRRLVSEKNHLQQNLDQAIYQRKLAENKLAAGSRELAQARSEVARAKEEADVAWELVAGQKYDRWRPTAWAVGGFLIGFLISGSYGYYYSEQTRNELLAKLKSNEELIKTAAWHPGQGQQDSVPASAETAAVVTAQPAADTQQSPLPVAPVRDDARQWWPVGSEFSVNAAIPMEQIKAAFGLKADSSAGELSDLLKSEILQTVNRWADSWAQQDLGGYFSSYSENYRPELGRSQQEWRKMRKFRLSKPQWIELNIDAVELRRINENQVQVKLKQSYRSDFYRDRVLKSLNLIREDGRWRIIRERSLGILSDDVVG